MNRSTPTALSAASEKHLTTYAAAALAGATVLTAAQVAQAGILTFTFGPQVLTGTNTLQKFQLFPNGPTLDIISRTGSSRAIGVFPDNLKTLPITGGIPTSGSRAYAANLAKGAAISAGKTFLANASFADIAHYSFQRYPSFFRNQTGYVGFKFTDPNISTQTDFGWVRIGVNQTETQLTIFSAAYDNTGASITAGQTGAVPEPGSLGLLAGGAGCLAAWRLRKAKRRQTADAGSALAS